MKWCFIGCGKIADNVARQIVKSGKHEIVTCFTRNPEKCQTFASRFGAIPCNDAITAITNENVEAVYIATTHNVHFKFAEMALKNQKPVLCEKPLTVTLDETEKLIKIAKENDTYLVEAMWSWFGKAPYKMKQDIENNEIGMVKEANFTYHMKSINYAPRVSNPHQAGGALLDVTIYPLTYAYRLFGYPESIAANGIIANGIDEGEDIVLTYKNNMKVTISVSITDFKGLEKMTINGTNGKIICPFFHFSGNYTIDKGFLKKKKYQESDHKISYLNEFDLVAEEIKAGLKESKIIPYESTISVMKMMEEIKKQIGLTYTELEE